MKKNQNQAQNILDFLLFIYDETIVKKNLVQSSAVKLMTDCQISNPSTVIKVMYSKGLIKNVSTNKKFTDLKYSTEVHPNIHMANKVVEEVRKEQSNDRVKAKATPERKPYQQNDRKPAFVSTTNESKPDPFLIQLFEMRDAAILEFNKSKEKLEKLNQLIKLY
ncbi:MAG: hypothetical protein V4547_16250 [Bacteroidota bacterium]